MFYLAELCRVCVKACARMMDIDAVDNDLIKFSEKLRLICSQMVISSETSPRRICYECIQKLRQSYAFHKQCIRSDQLFQQYMQELTSVQPEAKFVNSQLQVTIIPVPRLHANRASREIEECHSYSKLCKTRFTSYKHLVRYPDDGSESPEHSSQTSPSSPGKPVRLRRRLKQEASFRISEAYKERLKKISYVNNRITKEQRCLILKSLLSKNNEAARNQKVQNAIEKSKKETVAVVKPCTSKATSSNDVKKETTKTGGLRELLGFIRGYDFGYEVDESQIEDQCDASVLDRLESFSRTFFYNDFQDYRETILSLANDSESSDEEDMFGPYNEEEDQSLWPEFNHLNNNYNRIRVRSDIIDTSRKREENVTVKMEVDDSAAFNVHVKEEPARAAESDDESGGFVPAEFVQACYDQPAEAQCEHERFRQKINMGFQHFMKKIKANASKQAADSLSDPAAIVSNINRIAVIPEASTSCSESSLDLLTRLTNSSQLAKTRGRGGAASTTSSSTSRGGSAARKTYTRCHMKCRTKGKPFINPQLMEQFQRRSFKCDTCNRSFKSPGYLHSHCTKMGH